LTSRLITILFKGKEYKLKFCETLFLKKEHNKKERPEYLGINNG
jgi:hypothetical protein